MKASGTAKMMPINFFNSYRIDAVEESNIKWPKPGFTPKDIRS